MDQLRHFLNSGLPTGKKVSKKQQVLPGMTALGSINNNFLHNKINLHSKIAPTTLNKVTLPKSPKSRLPGMNYNHLSQFIRVDRHSYNDAPGEVKRGGMFDASKVAPIYNEDAKKFIDQNAKSLIAGTTLTPETKAQLDPYIKFGGVHRDIAGGMSRYVEGTGYSGPNAPALSMNTIIYRDSGNTGKSQTIDNTQKVSDPLLDGITIKSVTPKETKASGLIVPGLNTSSGSLQYNTVGSANLQNALSLGGSQSTQSVAPGFFDSMTSTSNLGSNIAKAIGSSSSGSSKSSSSSASKPVVVATSTVPKPTATAISNISAIDKAASKPVTTTPTKTTTSAPTFAPAPKPTVAQQAVTVAKNVGSSIAKGVSNVWKAVTGKK